MVPVLTLSPPVSVKRDYYEVLGVSRDADGTVIKKAYRKLAVELHPDRNPGNKEAEENFKVASEAYQVLSDPEKRALYDRYGHEGPRSSGFSGFSDVSDVFSAFGDIFGDIFGGGGGRRRGPARGADLETEVHLTLLEAATGVEKEVTVDRHARCGTCEGTGAAKGSSPERCGTCRGQGQVMHQQGFLMIQSTCPTCRGSGTIIKDPCKECRGTGLETKTESLSVSVPAGVDDGSTLRLAGRGEEAPRGGQPGNLYIHIRVKADPRFERDGAHLHTRLEVSFPQAALGATLLVPTLEGEAEIDLPAGTQPGEVIVLRGQGLPQLRGGGKGDLAVHVKLAVPKKLNKEQEEHLRAFAEAGGDKVKGEKQGLFGRRKK